MALLSLKVCTCPLSVESIICAKCGGPIEPVGVLARIDLGVQQWFRDLESESRLNSALTGYMAIDRQVRQGVPVTAAVQQAVKSIGVELSGLEERIERRLSERFDDLKGENEGSLGRVIEIVKQQFELILREIQILAEQGKSVAEVEARIKEASASLQTYLTAIRLPSVRGEEGETNILRDLEDAFLGQSAVRVEPLGGSDATDAIIKFYHTDVEIGRCLVEVKSRKTWSKDFLGQAKEDMKRYNAAFSVIAVEKLPKSAKARGFHIDTGFGVVVTTGPELVAPTITMFYEIHAASYRLQKHALDFGSLASDRDLVYYVEDNMKILDDCKKISDATDDAARIIKDHVVSIGTRLQENNRKIAKIVSRFPNSGVEGVD